MSGFFRLIVIVFVLCLFPPLRRCGRLWGCPRRI